MSISPYTMWIGGFQANPFDKCDEKEKERRLALISGKGRRK